MFIVRKLYEVEKTAEKRWFYTFIDQTRAGETLTVSFTVMVDDPNSKNTLPALWQKHGYTKNRLSSYLCVDVYATQPDGSCYGKYNPQIGVNGKLNFAWVLEDTEENRNKILNEIYRLATRPSVGKGL